MEKNVRVRFAPSPTGPLHIGGVRTALFNYLFAKKHNGTFYIRIEDTDQTRFVAKAEEYIFESLKWLGIEPDETIGKNEKFGPYRQSDRKPIYKQYAEELIEKGFAYYAFDTAEELDLLRKEAEEKGETFIYNHKVRKELANSLNMSKEELAQKLAQNIPYVVRFMMPVDETLVIKDMIRGEVKFNTSLLDDKVLFKSDGMPTYHLANIVDDHLQQTSHVIRGEEWLPSLPLHYLLYRSFGWDAPEFAHLPLILKPIGNGKLSKRDGDKLGFPVFPLEWISDTNEKSSGYREEGFFPEAVVNFLALLGWNDGTDKEIYSLDELISSFDLSRVNKSGAKFDPEKNKWFNHQYLIQKSNEELADYFMPLLQQKNIVANKEYVAQVIGLVKDRAYFVNDFYELSSFFFEVPTTYEEKATKNWNADTIAIIQGLLDKIESISNFDTQNIEQEIKNWIAEQSLGMGKVMQPFRICLVGAMKGPDVFQIANLLGKEEVCKRIKKVIDTFKF